MDSKADGATHEEISERVYNNLMYYDFARFVELYGGSTGKNNKEPMNLIPEYADGHTETLKGNNEIVAKTFIFGRDYFA